MNNTLILLIGTNPLPNYLVTKYFLEQKNENGENIFDDVLPIYSTEFGNQKSTEAYWKKLRIALNLKSSVEIKLNNVSQKESIEDDLKNQISVTNCLNGKSIHLNYTGGTKTMAVHVYNFFYNNFDDVEYSYLDVRDDILHQHNKQAKLTPIQEVSKKFNIDIDTLKSLHLLSFYDSANNTVTTIPPAKNCFKEFEDFLIIIQDEYEVWRNFIHKKNKIKGNKKLLKNNDFNYIISNNNYINEVNSVSFESFKLATELPNNFFSLNNIRPNEFDQYKKSIDYIFNDKYFEHICYNALEEAINKYNSRLKNEWYKIIHYGTSCSFKRTDNRGKEFEIDLYFIKGTHFYGISCTTSKSRSTIKSKGFEIIHRSKQIGGDETSAMVIYSNTDLEGLQEELQQDTGTNENRFIMKPFLNSEQLSTDLYNIINK